MSTLFYHKLLRVKHIVTIRLFEGRDDQRSLSRRRWKRNTGTEIAGREGANVPASRLTQQIDLDRLLGPFAGACGVGTRVGVCGWSPSTTRRGVAPNPPQLPRV